MTNWKVSSYYYLEAESEGEAWSMASLELPDNSQITTLERERARAYEGYTCNMRRSLSTNY